MRTCQPQEYKHWKILLFVVFFIAFALRLALIGRGPYHLDCLEVVVKASHTLEELKIDYMHGPGYPLMVLISAVFIGVFRFVGVNNPVFAVNFMSVIFSSVSVAVLFLITRRFFNTRAAFFGSIIFLFFPAFLSSSVYGVNASPAIFFILLAVLFMDKHSGGGIKYLILSSIALGLAVAVRLSDALVFAPMCIFCLIKSKDIKKLLYFAGFFLSTIALFYIPMYFSAGFAKIFSLSSDIHGARFMGLFSKTLPIAAGWGMEMLTLPGIALSLLGFILIFLNNKRIFIFLVSWSTITFFYYANVVCVEPRMLTIAFIPPIIAMGYFLSYFFLKYKPGVIFLFTAVVFLMFQSVSQALLFRHRYSLQKDFALWVAEKTEKNSVIIARDERLFLAYYTGRETAYCPASCSKQAINRYCVDLIDSNLNKGKKVYIIESAVAYDYCYILRKKLESDYILALIGSRINEDWHHRCVSPYLFEEALIEISKK